MSDKSKIAWTEALRERFWANVNKDGPIAPTVRAIEENRIWRDYGPEDLD